MRNPLLRLEVESSGVRTGVSPDVDVDGVVLDLGRVGLEIDADGRALAMGGTPVRLAHLSAG